MENDIKNDKELYSYFVQRNVIIFSVNINFIGNSLQREFQLSARTQRSSIIAKRLSFKPFFIQAR